MMRRNWMIRMLATRNEVEEMRMLAYGAGRSTQRIYKCDMYHIYMWIAKLRAKDSEGVLGSRTKRFNVSISGYIISFKKEGEEIISNIMCIISGNEKNKKYFLKDLKKAKEVRNLESKDNFVIAQISDPLKIEPAYSPGILQIEPITIDERGDNYYTVGSWNRKELNKFISFLGKKFGIEILEIKNKKLSNSFFFKFKPELTKKQKEALDIAIKNGYYDYPRKTSVEKMAKLSNISFSAFHAHLRKAEKKTIPVYDSGM